MPVFQPRDQQGRATLFPSQGGSAGLIDALASSGLANIISQGFLQGYHRGKAQDIAERQTKVMEKAETRQQQAQDFGEGTESARLLKELLESDPALQRKFIQNNPEAASRFGLMSPRTEPTIDEEIKTGQSKLLRLEGEKQEGLIEGDIVGKTLERMDVETEDIRAGTAVKREQPALVKAQVGLTEAQEALTKEQREQLPLQVAAQTKRANAAYKAAEAAGQRVEVERDQLSLVESKTRAQLVENVRKNYRIATRGFKPPLKDGDQVLGYKIPTAAEATEIANAILSGDEDVLQRKYGDLQPATNIDLRTLHPTYGRGPGLHRQRPGQRPRRSEDLPHHVWQGYVRRPVRARRAAHQRTGQRPRQRLPAELQAGQ